MKTLVIYRLATRDEMSEEERMALCNTIIDTCDAPINHFIEYGTTTPVHSVVFMSARS
jgi:hypothetical protein